MQAVTTIGLDIAKSVFQVHGVDAAGQVLIRRQLKRRAVLAFFQKLPVCLVGIEACASSHYWSRELQALGHSVRLMSPAYVKPYVKRQKNDMADAEAICEAVARANMRFVPTKTPEQQSCLMLHRTRHLFIRQQTAVINSIRAHLAEFGIVAPVGIGLKEQIVEFDRLIMAWYRSNETSKRLHYIPGVGPLLATALAASVLTADCPSQGATSRLGSGSYRSSTRVVARTGSAVSANKVTGIYAACLWPAHSVIRYARIHGTKHRPTALLARRPTKVAAIALANTVANEGIADMGDLLPVERRE